MLIKLVVYSLGGPISVCMNYPLVIQFLPLLYLYSKHPRSRASVTNTLQVGFLLSWKPGYCSLFSMTMILISVYFFVESSWWDTFSSNSNYNYETCFFPPYQSPTSTANYDERWWVNPCCEPTRLGIHWPDIMPTESIYFIREYNNKALECTEMIKWIWGRWSASGLEWGSHSIRLWFCQQGFSSLIDSWLTSCQLNPASFYPSKACAG
jgi:hypothetical protein